jgi:hypothetical protein
MEGYAAFLILANPQLSAISPDGYYIAPIDETQVRADIEISPVCLTRNGEWVYGAKQTEAQAAEGNIL